MADPFSSAQAAQNVMYQRQFGSGLGTQQAMQSPDYQLGSGSSLRQAPRQIGTRSGAMRREARRLRKQGYTAQAGQLAGAAAMQKLQEGSAIKSEAQRGIETGQRIQAGALAQQQQDLMRKSMDYTSRLLDKRMKDLEDEKPSATGLELQEAQASGATSSLPSSGATAKSVGSTGTTPTASTSTQTSLPTLDPAQMETEGSGQLGGMFTATGPLPAAPAAPKPSLIDGRPASEVLAAGREKFARESDPEGYARQQRLRAIEKEARMRAAKTTSGGQEGFMMAQAADDGGYEAKTVTPEQKAGYDAYFFDKKQAAAQAEKDKATREQDAEIAKQRRRAEELMRGFSR